jgi:threonylcarbamoyladenosine tRNA methylthiotransferase MtaB
MKTFKIKTFGCKVNQYEAQVIREGLLSAGFAESGYGQPAGLCIVNTCTVTHKADRECRETLRRFLKENPDARIIAAGCYVEQDGDIVKNIDKRIEILNNQQKMDIAKYVKDRDCFVADAPRNDGSVIASEAKQSQTIAKFKCRTRAFIKVQDGCNNFCSYCKVPLVRGRSRSRDPEEVYREAKALIDSGYKELVLTGICLGDYGKYSYKGTDLSGLIRKISEIKKDFRIRLSSIELQDVTGNLIEEISGLEKMCRHLHIPLQNGDDDILRQMNRKYTVHDFVSKVEHVRSMLPDIGITTDIIVGFPGEKESNFENTIETVEKIHPSRTHIFTYSPRPGTRAATLKDDVPGRVKKQRMKILKMITDNMSIKFRDSLADKEHRVLIEHNRDRVTGKLCGYTDNYVKVLIDGPDELMGSFILYKSSI